MGFHNIGGIAKLTEGGLPQSVKDNPNEVDTIKEGTENIPKLLNDKADKSETIALAKKKENLNMQLEDIKRELNVVKNHVTYAENFERQVPENDDTSRLQRAIEHAERIGGVLMLSSIKYLTSATLRIKEGIKIFSEHNQGTNAVGKSFGAEISYGGTGNAMDLIGANGLIYGVVMENIRFSRQSTSATPNIAVNYYGSEVFFREVRVNGGYKIGMKIDGSIGRIYDSIFSACEVGLQLYRANNFIISGCNFWDNSKNHILLNNVSDSHIRDNWFERSQIALLLTNRERGAGLLGTLIENNRFDTTIANKYFNSRTFVIENVSSERSLFIQNSSFENNLCLNEQADHNIEIFFSNIHSSSYFNNFKVSGNIFYGCKISAIKGDSPFIYVWLEKNRCQSEYMTGEIIPETSGQITFVGMDQGSTDIRLKSPLRLGKGTHVAYVNGQIWYEENQNAAMLVSKGNPKKIPLNVENQTDSAATDVTSLKTDFNNLLKKLRESGLLG